MNQQHFCDQFHLYDLQPDLLNKLFITFNSSTFFARFLSQNPKYFININWLEVDTLEDITHDITALFSASEINKTNESLPKALRLLRQRIHAKLVFQQQHQYIQFTQIAKIISLTAKEILRQTEQYLRQQITLERKLHQTPDPLAIITMGKLGGNELNFSSDIDLVFIQTNNLPLLRQSGSEYSPMRFYTELGQRLIALLNDVTIDGFVYRIDMRLRPFGDGAPLVTEFESFKHYLIHHARDWERYAYIKADILHPNTHFTNDLKHNIHQFVYRHYHDYRMLNAIRDMKHKIVTEMKSSTLKNNIKLGRGGIREIEFICQCYQLVYGGQNITLQTNQLAAALDALQKADILPAAQTTELYAHYVFLRDVENALQMFDDQQTHQLPDTEFTQKNVASLVGYDSWQTLTHKIESTRANVSSLFDELTRFNTLTSNNTTTIPIANLEKATDITVKINEDNAKQIEIDQFFLKYQSQISEDVLPAIKHLLQLCLHTYPHLIKDILVLLNNLSKRQTYLFLLLEHQARHLDFLELLNKGQRIIEMLTEHPFLLERALIYKAHDDVYLDIDYLRNSLRIYLQAIDIQDIEDFLESLRRFRLEQVFNIIVSESRGHISLMESSDLFSHLATVIIEAVLDGAWREVFQYSDITENLQTLYKQSLGVIAYGKLGGLELSVASDLDLVFVHDRMSTELSPRLFVRAVQKFVHFMQIKTYHGTLYEIDLRLRPEGDNGFIVPSFDSYCHYLKTSAWTWEHQALTRARMIYASDDLTHKFNALRSDVIYQKRDLEQLKKDIIDMRHRMREHLLKVNAQEFDLKQSIGGMVDIEFIAQFFALFYSHKVPFVCYYSDSIRIIQTMESARLIDIETANTLIEHYCYFRDLGFKRYLDKQPSIVPLSSCQHQADEISVIWHRLFF
ncbi:bifunctional [glutamate--ammonia ligase]-adenylyl-L-tyrosine phosphorylase/[glutamate--ammonia-ligase] adenylyltransferase [Cysteiniphilum sp. QT6929]|uniref:bifunctional [glutamate--ammonia ligase]-adenylyl-L-tyrosine phosphorylase/[glutamate--ammonia-ligase] adenylyltransferase n=1 Tax=Cysteiniphilum sp. QT6929 TaxID=2975055 RepID=UPI0024B3A64E|nr:bifunctional [glutamate--ammonia ligase]-adenylyl-L-tyrosine phosphorylase/[glutamate--ammonia-ligase] adenylyltransferase [Cysteiniphilum sp. QT6929]WHN65449.1 bifunctional [glutamate--ammonia ligase]-adenylyl-L-tyrosine phosphorylase/[glutamate--ammonia-ligase] adenylyltransferase [Cysteiniphilum sp. QT6929]